MTYKLGLIGYPVQHSLSPHMHRAALGALKLDGDYTAIAVRPAHLHETIAQLVARGYRGLNVTIPYKQAVMPLMDELSESAQAIGAVNTILVAHGKLIGHNTDAIGFMRGLARADCDARGKTVLVIGAGGAARAVVYALKRAGAQLTIWNRTRERAEQLSREFDVQVAARLSPPSRCGGFDLIVNTTSVGMTPHCADAPLRLSGRGFGARVVYDLVYQPRETALLREARTVGAQVVSGIEMLIHQGAEAFRLWTEREAPTDVMREAIADCGF